MINSIDLDSSLSMFSLELSLALTESSLLSSSLETSLKSSVVSRFFSSSRRFSSSSAFCSSSNLLCFSASILSWNFLSSSRRFSSSFIVSILACSILSISLSLDTSRFLYQSVDHKWYIFQPRPSRTCSLSLSLSLATLLDAYILPSVVIPKIYLPGLLSSIIAKSTLKPAHPTCLSTL